MFGSKGLELYDNFDLDLQTSQEGLKFYAPSDLGYFLSQIETSQFTGCNFNTARNWKAGLPSEEFLKVARDGLHAMKRLTKSLKINFWLASGTLLGWYRQCDVIPYTTDFDFATWAYYAKDEPNYRQEVQAALARDRDPLYLYCTYGFPKTAYEMTFETKGTHFDLFFTYEEGNKHTYGGHMVWKSSYFSYIYPKMTLCSGIFLGEKVLVPCNSEAVVAAEYGPKWTEPVSKWSFYESPFNVGPVKEWPRGTTGYYWSN